MPFDVTISLLMSYFNSLKITMTVRKKLSGIYCSRVETQELTEIETTLTLRPVSTEKDSTGS